MSGETNDSSQPLISFLFRLFIWEEQGRECVRIYVLFIWICSRKLIPKQKLCYETERLICYRVIIHLFVLMTFLDFCFVCDKRR